MTRGNEFLKKVCARLENREFLWIWTLDVFVLFPCVEVFGSFGKDFTKIMAVGKNKRLSKAGKKGGKKKV